MPAPATLPDLDIAYSLDTRFTSGIRRAQSALAASLPDPNPEIAAFTRLVEEYKTAVRTWRLTLTADQWKAWKKGQLSYLSDCSRHLSSGTLRMDDAARDMARYATGWKGGYLILLKDLRKRFTELKTWLKTE